MKAKSVFHTEILRDELKLCKASQKGETEEVRKLLLSGMVDADNIDSSVHSDSYTSVLSVAADGGHLDVVRLLIDSGADPNKASKQYEGFSPLHHAVKSGRIDVVQLLLDAGAEPNATNSGQEASGYRANGEGQTPMYLAARWGYWDIFQLLKDLTGGELPLIMAAQKDDYHAMQVLLEAGADPNMTNLNGETPLIAAIRTSCYHDVLHLLLENGAEPNKRTKYGDTPLHFAAWNINYVSISLVKVLIQAGADPNIANILGRTPLHGAARHGRIEVVKLMMDSGADKNKTDEEGKTPLEIASENGHLNIVNILTDKEPQPHRHMFGVKLPRFQFQFNLR